ncbi:hypothetical protein DFJ43DRAFT_1062773 [Lentinula guzmanii]|uniref:Uncharacterized protein n=1 Tax=Lentinula guzmanii TaxID=2804957 RepID=A0AA38MVH9_9AGAR|nr:hypothetical protein DFJ43DRAFT_1062773 [Lentinula guzmanii]
MGLVVVVVVVRLLGLEDNLGPVFRWDEMTLGFDCRDLVGWDPVRCICCGQEDIMQCDLPFQNDGRNHHSSSSVYMGRRIIHNWMMTVCRIHNIAPVSSTKKVKMRELETKL